MPPAITRLAQRHPLLRIEVTELEPEVALPALLAGSFDVVMAEEYPGHPLPRSRQTEREDLIGDELHLVLPAGWGRRGLAELGDRPFVMETVGTTSRSWATAHCREAGFEPDVRYTSTDLQVHLRIVEEGLAAALLPALAGARTRDRVRVRRLEGRPERRIFTIVRRGARRHPTVGAFTEALRHGAAAR